MNKITKYWLRHPLKASARWILRKEIRACLDYLHDKCRILDEINCGCHIVRGGRTYVQVPVEEAVKAGLRGKYC